MLKDMPIGEAITYFVGLQKEVLDAEAHYKELLKKYKDATRDHFGIADGDPASLLQLVALIQRVTNDKLR